MTVNAAEAYKARLDSISDALTEGYSDEADKAHIEALSVLQDLKGLEITSEILLHTGVGKTVVYTALNADVDKIRLQAQVLLNSWHCVVSQAHFGVDPHGASLFNSPSDDETCQMESQLFGTATKRRKMVMPDEEEQYLHVASDLNSTSDDETELSGISTKRRKIIMSDLEEQARCLDVERKGSDQFVGGVAEEREALLAMPDLLQSPLISDVEDDPTDDTSSSKQSSEECTDDASGSDEETLLASRRAIRNRNREKRGEPFQDYLDTDDEFYAQFES